MSYVENDAIHQDRETAISPSQQTECAQRGYNIMKATKIFSSFVLLVLVCSSVLMAQTDSEPVEMVFYNDLALGVPFQDAYIETEDGMVKRVELTDPISALFQPLYTITFDNPPDLFEEPFDIGPYEMGEPMGITLGEWLAARGTGTYTVSGDRATLDLHFDNLVPNGVYTLWCIETNLVTFDMADDPCGAADGTENEFVADGDGSADFSMEIDAFPSSTDEVIYTVALAYHSDGQTYGASPGEFGRNVHVQLIYDFLPADM